MNLSFLHLGHLSLGSPGFPARLMTRVTTPASGRIYETQRAMAVGAVDLGFLGSRPSNLTYQDHAGYPCRGLGSLGAFVYLVAVTRGKVSLVVNSTAMYALFSIGLTVLFPDEELNLHQETGGLRGANPKATGRYQTPKVLIDCAASRCLLQLAW